MLQRPHGSQEVAAAIVPSRSAMPPGLARPTQGVANMLSSGALQARGGAITTAARGTLLGGSSNGRTADSDSASLGSNPSPPASYFQSLEGTLLSNNQSHFLVGVAERTP